MLGFGAANCHHFSGIHKRNRSQLMRELGYIVTHSMSYRKLNEMNSIVFRLIYCAAQQKGNCQGLQFYEVVMV